MLERLAPTCEQERCDRELRDRDLMLAMRTADGERRAYECDCGAVTITIAEVDSER